MPEYITATVTVNKPLQIVWEKWNNPEDIKNWNIPFDDWHCPLAENDIRESGRFYFKMERKDGKEGFDYGGEYVKVIPNKYIETRQDDGRKSIIEFQENGQSTIISETFEPEDQTPINIQKDFCQSVLNRFKKYTEQD
jgi:uncharacterized protein YndB with AHSA1/START domain